MRPISNRLIERLRCPDGTARVLTEAQVEIATSLVQRKSQWQTADTVTLREHDFPSADVLDAELESSELTLTNAPAGNNLYTAHFKLTITPDAPGAGTNNHEVVVIVETDTVPNGTWLERGRIIYQLARKVGESEAAVTWPHEEITARVAGLTSTSKLRLKIFDVTLPGTATFQLLPFNKATDSDLTAGVTYHTGPALDFLDDGVTLASNIQTKVSHAASDGFETDLGGPPTEQGASPFIVARIVWGADDPADMPIDRIIARLDPDRDGIPGNKNVAYWICQPWALKNIRTVQLPNIPDRHLLDLVPLTEPLRVAAGAGTSAADVTFSWAERTFYLDGRPTVFDRKPRPKSIVPSGFHHSLVGGGPPGIEYDTGPTTFVFIWAIQTDGTPATNVGWARDSAVNESTNGSRKLRTVGAFRTNQFDGGWQVEAPITNSATPRPVFRMRVETGSFANEKIQFSGAGNDFDLGATPTNDVEFSAEAEIPLGSTAIFEVLKDGGVAGTDADWRAYTDGQLNTDLADVTKRQTYELRCRMTTNAGGDVTPVLRALGVREITKVPLWDVVDFKACRWAVDPVELVPRIPEATFVAIKDGDNDARDRITELLSDHDRGDITLRTWMGDPERPRSEWVHLDDFFLDDWDPGAASVILTGISPLVLLKGALPKYDTATESRQPKTYANQTPKAAAASLIGTDIGLPGRYRGAEIEDESALLTHTITDSEAKDELDAVAYLARGAWTSEAGRIRFVNLLDPGAVRHVFDPNEIEPLSVSPGLRQALHEFFSKYNWDETENRYRGEVLSTPAITPESFGGTGFKGISRLDPPQRLRDSVCRWIPTEQLAKDVGRLRIEGLSTGLRVWRFRSNYPYPELRIGDRVTVPTDRFILHDPVANRALRGALWATGPIVEVGDPAHREFGVWIRTLADIVGGGEVGTRTGDGVLQPIPLTLSYFWRANRLFVTWAGGSDVASVKVATSTTDYPAAGTGTAANGQNGAFDAGTFTYGQTGFVTVTPYSATAAGGTQGTSQRLRARLMIDDTQYDETTGKRLRTGQFSDGGYAVRAADTAGKEAFDDLFVLATKTVKVGTVASPGSITKTLRIAHAVMVPRNDGETWTFNEGYARPGSTVAILNLLANAIFVKGVTLTNLRARLYRETGSDVAEVRLYRNDDSGGATLLATLTHSTTAAWQTVSASLSQLVGDQHYTAACDLQAASNVDDARLAWIEVDYTMPSYDKGY